MAKFDSDLDLCFQALADTTRRRILTRLARGPATVGELAAPIDMALPTVMAHLKKLEDAGLVTSEKKGRIRTCALAPDAFLPAQHWLDEQRSLWTARLDGLDAYVATLMKDPKT